MKKVGKYKLGYAESKDLINWNRKDDLVRLKPIVKNEWDSEMIAYPYVIKFEDKKYIFYNGNSYGRDGVALAIEKYINDLAITQPTFLPWHGYFSLLDYVDEVVMLDDVQFDKKELATKK